MADVRIAAVVVALVAGCGRLQFDSLPAGEDGDGGGVDSTPAVCGDSVCSGGEVCPSCNDCNTQLDVCGNGACSATEDSASCYADCGPTPWTWLAQETELLDLLDQARTGGTDCPGPTGTTTAPALARIPSLTNGAREWVWEVTYQKLPITMTSCNGRSVFDRVYEAGGANEVAVWHNDLQPTPQTALAALLSDMTICESLMGLQHTRVGVGVAYVDGLVLHLIMID